MVATTGVLRTLWIRPNALGSVWSRPIVNNVLVTWIKVVSSVATVESSTATIKSLPPQPCHTAWPRTVRMFDE